GGAAVPLGAGGAARPAYERGRVCLQVAHEDVHTQVAVGGVEVGGQGVECDEAPVGRDRGDEGVVVPLRARGSAGTADERGRVGLQVAHVHVPARVAVPRIEVRGGGQERNEAPVGGDRGSQGFVVPLRARGSAGAADERGRVGLQVAHEHIA